jgi:hypothetical protein
MQNLAHTTPLALSASHFSNFQVKFFDPFIQEEREVCAGRMECTMQNLAHITPLALSASPRTSQTCRGSSSTPSSRRSVKFALAAWSAVCRTWLTLVPLLALSASPLTAPTSR